MVNLSCSNDSDAFDEIATNFSNLVKHFVIILILTLKNEKNKHGWI